MAYAKGKASAVLQNSLSEVDELAALSDEGIAIPFNVADDGKILLVVQNTGGAAADVTVKQGNGLQGVGDYVASVPAGKSVYGVFESGAFLNVSGGHIGKILLSGPTTVKAGAIALPF
jgi:hypothetical protein